MRTLITAGAFPFSVSRTDMSTITSCPRSSSKEPLVDPTSVRHRHTTSAEVTCSRRDIGKDFARTLGLSPSNRQVAAMRISVFSNAALAPTFSRVYTESTPLFNLSEAFHDCLPPSSRAFQRKAVTIATLNEAPNCTIVAIGQGYSLPQTDCSTNFCQRGRLRPVRASISRSVRVEVAGTGWNSVTLFKSFPHFRNTRRDC